MMEWRGLLMTLSEMALVHAVGKIVKINILVKHHLLFGYVRCVPAKLCCVPVKLP